MDAAVEVGWVWLPKVRLDGALVPKAKLPPEEAAEAAGVVTWTLVDPNANPPKELPVPVIAAGAAAGTAAGTAARAAAGAAAGWEA